LLVITKMHHDGIIWKLRNDMCFQGVGWQGMGVLLRKGARMLRDW
jgi:hypothetical protein